MKNMAFMALILAVALGLCACGRRNEENTVPPTTTTQATVPTTTATMPTIDTNIPDPDINTTEPDVTLAPTFDATVDTTPITDMPTTESTSSVNRRK